MTTKQKKARALRRLEVHARRHEIQHRWNKRSAIRFFEVHSRSADLSTEQLMSDLLHLSKWVGVAELVDALYPLLHRELLVKALRTIELKEMPYQDYLQTPEWKERAERAKARWNGRCALDVRHEAEHAHHRTYDRRGREHENDLIPLCADCHQRFHR